MQTKTINTQRYPIKIFYFEYFITVFSLIGVLLNISIQYQICILFILFVLKYNLQGLRMNIILCALTAMSCLLDLKIPTFLLTVLSLYSINIFTVYNLPKSKATLSYRAINVQNCLFTIFYPTNMNTNKSKINLFQEDVALRMYDLVNKDPGKPSKLPMPFVKIMTHYYTKMSINNVIQSASCIDKQYELIIISHQLGFNSLFSLAKQFVESGYIVLLVDHPQQIKNIHPDADNTINKQFRKSQLIQRYKAIVKALDYITINNNLQKLLGDNVIINKDKINIMGHSFGGTTALYSAINDKRITGSVIAFDPCFYLMQDSYTLNHNPLQLSNNIIILLAQDYYQKNYPFFQNDFRAQMFRSNVKNARILRMIGANHANYSELALFTCGQFNKFNVIRNCKSVIYFQMSIALAYQTLNSVHMKSQQQLIQMLKEQNPKHRRQIDNTLKNIFHESFQRQINDTQSI